MPASEFVTERLVLVPLQPEDAGEMCAVLADATLYEFIGGQPPLREDLEGRYRAWAKGSPRPGEDWHNWVVRLAEDGTAIGHVQATVMDGGRRADIGWLIGVPWQGRGYATEAARALVTWLEAAGSTTITAHVHPDHAASAIVAASAGLGRTDELEDGEIVWHRVR